VVSIHIWLRLGTIIPTADVTLSFACSPYKDAHLIRLLLSTLSSYTMIVLLMTLNSILGRLDRVTLHVSASPVSVRAVAVALSSSLARGNLLLLHHLLIVQIHRIL
jgi:hypothetical protein